MILFFFFSLMITVTYTVLITVYHLTWKAVPVVDLSPGYKPQTFISIVIAVRNEEAMIKACIQSILLNNYPKHLFELIIVDDYSSDSTFEKIKEIDSKQLNVLRLEHSGKLNHGKKAALLYGIQQAKGEFIVTTDGDCLVSKNWLLHFSYPYEKMGKKCLPGLVRITPNHFFVESFQALDNLATMGVNTAANYSGWHFAANGANLGFEKALFFHLSAYEGNEHLSSGDDMFLIQKIADANPDFIFPIKHPEHVVNTIPESNWNALFNQRIRWASKTKAYRDKRMILLFGFLFLFQLSLVLNLLLALIWGQIYLILFAVQFAVKGMVDYLFLYALTDFFDQKDIRRYFLKASIYLVPFNLVLYVRAITAKSYKWKGRKLK